MFCVSLALRGGHHNNNYQEWPHIRGDFARNSITFNFTVADPGGGEQGAIANHLGLVGKTLAS